LVVLAAAGVSDVLDGWYARRFHQQSETGAVLDAFTDKVFVVVVVVALVMSGSMRLLEALLLGTRDYGELALAARLALGGRREQLAKPHSSNIGGKIATTLQYVAVVAIILGVVGRAIWIGAAAVAGVVASISYWRRDVARDAEHDVANATSDA
jgi:phosphatidylglycerophosphate synthase